MDSRPIVDWYGHIESVSGYGRHARGITFNMDLDKVDLSVLDPDEGKRVELTEEQKHRLSKMQKGIRNDIDDLRAIEVYNFTPWSAVHEAYQGDAFSFWNPNVYKVLCTVYESPQIPEFWVSMCNQFDEIWTPSEHAKQAFKNSGVRDSMEYRVFREGVDTDQFHPNTPKLVNNDQFTFLSVFDFTYRKGWDKLIRAYCDTFAKDDDVKLLLKTHYSGNTEDDKRKIKRYIDHVRENSENDPEIEYYWDWIKEKDMAKLYNSADAFVLPTRGEGFGLPLAEAAACDLPVITTDHFAPTEFLDDNTYWVGVDEMRPYPFSEAIQHEPNCTGLPFAEPDLNDLKRQMKKVYEEDDPASPDVSSLDWKEPADKTADRLQEIWYDWNNVTSLRGS